MFKLPKNSVDRMLVLSLAVLIPIILCGSLFLFLFVAYSSLKTQSVTVVDESAISQSLPEVDLIETIAPTATPTEMPTATPITDEDALFLVSEAINPEKTVNLGSLDETDAKNYFLERRYYYINRFGEIVFEPAVLASGKFNEGLAPARAKTGWGYIDKTGEFIIEPQFQMAGMFCNGFGSVRTGEENSSETWTFVDRNGQMITEPQFREVYPFSESLAAVRIGNGNNQKWGYIDESGRYVINPQFNQAYSFREGLAAVKLDGLYGFIDANGDFVIPPKFTDVNMMFTAIPRQGNVGFYDGMASIQINNELWGYIDKSGNFVIPPQFAQALNFSEGLAAVMNDDSKWGFVDENGQFVIEPQFDGASQFSEGLATVAIATEKAEKIEGIPIGTAYWGFIDTEGSFVINPRFEGIALPFTDGLAEVTTIVAETVDEKTTMATKSMFINHDGIIVWETTEKVIFEP